MALDLQGISGAVSKALAKSAGAGDPPDVACVEQADGSCVVRLSYSADSLASRVSADADVMAKFTPAGKKFVSAEQADRTSFAASGISVKVIDFQASAPQTVAAGADCSFLYR